MHEGADGHGVRKRIGLLLLGITVFASNFRGEAVPTIRRTVTEVGLTLVATDHAGRSVSTLSPTDIAVLENGQPVPNFELRQATNNPLRVGIMLDLSESTRKTWELTQPFVVDFLRQLVRPGDRMLLVAFDTKVEVESPFTEAQQATTLFAKLRGGGPTALYDAVYSTCQHSTFDNLGETGRGALIVFSDGEDNLSLHDLDQVIGNAQTKGIAVYTISVHRRRFETAGDQVLHRLAEATGGRDFVVKEGRQVQAALRTISSELRSYYLLYYTPLHGTNRREFRHVRVVPTREAGPLLRYRDGYYAAPIPGEH